MPAPSRTPRTGGAGGRTLVEDGELSRVTSAATATFPARSVARLGSCGVIRPRVGQVSPLVVVRLQGLQVQEDRRAVLARGLEQRRGNQVPEPHAGGFAARLNWLRAAVLGANDGIVSTAGLVVGVAGATAARSAILTAGLAGLSAGSLAMASGEYVSVSSQRDSERALLARERRELAEAPQAELAELALLYQARAWPPAWPGRSPNS